jgi:hypothetical protein
LVIGVAGDEFADRALSAWEAARLHVPDPALGLVLPLKNISFQGPWPAYFQGVGGNVSTYDDTARVRVRRGDYYDAHAMFRRGELVYQWGHSRRWGRQPVEWSGLRGKLRDQWGNPLDQSNPLFRWDTSSTEESDLAAVPRTIALIAEDWIDARRHLPAPALDALGAVTQVGYLENEAHIRCEGGLFFVDRSFLGEPNPPGLRTAITLHLLPALGFGSRGVYSDGKLLDWSLAVSSCHHLAPTGE